MDEIGFTQFGYMTGKYYNDGVGSGMPAPTNREVSPSQTVEHTPQNSGRIPVVDT